MFPPSPAGTESCAIPLDASSASVDSAPLSFTSFPNPFTRQTSVTFALHARSDTRLDVHDVQGRLVRRLLAGPLERGAHTVVWSGRDRSGRPVPPGVYFLRLDRSGSVETRKSILLR